MPEVRYFTVTQEREVKVSADHPLAAAQLGQAAFDGQIDDEDLARLHVTKPVRQRSLEVREDY